MPDEILQKRREEGAQKLRTFLTGKTDFPYLDMVLSLMHTEDEQVPTFSAEQIAAAALELLYGAQQSDLPDATGLNREKKRRSPKDYVKFIIDAGYNARMVPNFIVGAIAERTGLSGRDIGKIEIFEDNTTVEIPQEQAEEVLSSMQDCRINGKKVRISVLPTEKRRKGADQKEKFKKDGKKTSFEKSSFQNPRKRGFSENKNNSKRKKASYSERFASYTESSPESSSQNDKFRGKKHNKTRGKFHSKHK